MEPTTDADAVPQTEDVAPREQAAPPVFHMIVIVNTITQPTCRSFSTEDELIAAVRSTYAQAEKNPHFWSRARVYLFKGDQVHLVGDPRHLRFPDGRLVVVGAAQKSDPSDQEAFLLPNDGN